MGITLVLTTRGCTLDTARRIGEALGTPWLNSNDPSFEDAWNRTSFFLELPETERVLGIVRMTPAMQTFVREFDEGEIDWLVDEIDKASKGMVSPGLIGSA